MRYRLRVVKLNRFSFLVKKGEKYPRLAEKSSLHEHFHRIALAARSHYRDAVVAPG